MGALSAKDKDAMFKDFIRAKNLHAVKMQEEAKMEKKRQKTEELAKK